MTEINPPLSDREMEEIMALHLPSNIRKAYDSVRIKYCTID
jgi:hypothetical protein